MAREGFSVTTYEVFASEDGRWVVDGIYQVEARAREHAEGLAASGRCEAVRITASTDGSRERVVFEKKADRREKPVSIVPIESAPPCATIEDFYGFEARRAGGRLLRRFLDRDGITVLELLFNPVRLRLLERNDTLFPQAVGRLAQVQAKAAGSDARTRTDELYHFFATLKERAKAMSERTRIPQALREQGIDALLARAATTTIEGGQDAVLRAALAARLGEAGDWDSKVSTLIEMAGACGDGALAYLDEAIAEILDGAAALAEILGGLPDAATAQLLLARLADGRAEPPPTARPCLAALNELIARRTLPLTRLVLLERVQRELAGTRPLTREGDRKAEAGAFSTLLGALATAGGLAGGPAMAEAATQRARIALSGGDADLSVDAAVACILAALPSPESCFGYLLDLAASPMAARYEPAILAAIGSLTRHVADAGAAGPKPDLVAMRRRLDAAALPTGLANALGQTLERLAAATGADDATAAPVADAAAEAAGPTAPATPGPPPAAVGRRALNTGDALFAQGTIGDEAYVVLSGRIEVRRGGGANQTVLATFGRGEVLAEGCLVGTHTHTTSAAAAEPTELLTVPRAMFEERLARLAQTDRILHTLIKAVLERAVPGK